MHMRAVYARLTVNSALWKQPDFEVTFIFYECNVNIVESLRTPLKSAAEHCSSEWTELSDNTAEFGVLHRQAYTAILAILCKTARLHSTLGFIVLYRAYPSTAITEFKGRPSGPTLCQLMLRTRAPCCSYPATSYNTGN